MNDELIKGKKQSTFYFLSKKQKFCIICTLFFGLVFFVLSFFIPTIVSNFIDGQIPEQVVMQESNSDLWAKLPGKSNVDLYRKITIYEPKNLIDVIFRGTKPEFIEHENVYSLIQHQELVDRKYLDNKVTANRYTTFQEAESGKEEKSYTIINPGLFGGWHLGKSAPPPKLAWMTIGQVLQNLKDQLPLNIMYLGFEHNFVKDEASAMALLAAEQDETKRKQMYYDEFMGIKSANTMENWVKMSLEGSEFGVAGQALKDYFDISQGTLSSLYKTLQQPITGLNHSAFPFYKCNPYGQDPSQYKFKYSCTGKFLTAKQWQSSDITAHPPDGMGIDPTDSVSFTNNTLHDFIEIYYYYKSSFKGKIADYGDLEFDLDWAMDFLDREYDYPTKQQLTDPHILQHKGNIEYLFAQGEIFDKSNDLKDLQGVMDRFKLDSLEKAHVLYKWLDQMGRDFAYRENLNGNVEYGVIGIFASESIYYNFRNLTEYLQPTLIANYVMNNQKWKDCSQFLTDSIDDITEENIKSICSEDLFKVISQQTILKIQELCIYDGYGPLLTEFQNKHKLSDIQKLQICSDEGTTDSSFQTHLLNAHNQLKIQYLCTYDRCSKMELAIRQWARSEITQNPLQGTTLKQSYSVSDWDNQIFPHPFEYGYFAQNFVNIFPYDQPPQILTDLETKLLLHFRGIFNPLAITTAFIFSLNHPQYYDEFVNRYQFKYYDHLLYYIRFATINGMLGGATITKTPKELFFGYSEHLGEDLKTRDPAGGGDPGINSWVRMGDPNMTLEDAKLFPLRINTGADDLTKTRTFVDINQYQHAMYNYSYFDGNTTTTVWENPWNIPEKFDKATDGVIFPPFRNTEDEVEFYVPQVYRTIKFLPTPGPQLFGLDTVHYEVDLSDWDKLEDYNNFWSGTINMEKPFSAPATVSLPHFYKADKSLQDSVIFYNEDNQVIQANDYDKIYANVEKFSGAPLQAVIQLMISMRVQKDALFPKCNEMALPLLILYNSGNFTDSTASDQFGELKMGLAVQNWGWYILMGFGIFLICISVLIVFKAYPNSKKKREQVLVDN